VRRDQLEQLIRAASFITKEKDFVILGSQSILGTVPDAPRLAPKLSRSIEADIYPRWKPEVSDEIEGAMGELSEFHEQHGFYADAVEPQTAILPRAWESRLVKIENENTNGARGWCLEVHDLAVAKLAAGREKDFEFVDAMLEYGLVQIEMLRTRLADTALDPARAAKSSAWLRDREPKR
jgi:hypothetical protein